MKPYLPTLLLGLIPGFTCSQSPAQTANGTHAYAPARSAAIEPAVHPLQVVNAADFGVRCDGKTDDTTAIQNALDQPHVYNLPLTKSENVVIQLPQGSCLLSRPLKLGFHGSIVGQGESTYLVADYAIWVGKDYNAIEIVDAGLNPGGASIGARRIGNFNLIGISNRAIPGSAGIYIANTANIYEPDRRAFNNLSVDTMKISGFDTAVDVQDLINSRFQFLNISDVRVGFNFHGDAQNIFLAHNAIESGSWSATSIHTPTIGLNIVQNTKYGQKCGTSLYCAPQGIFLNGNTILSFDYDINVGQCNQCNFSDNTIDQAAAGPAGYGAAIQLGQQANGGGGIWIARNLIGVLSPKNSSIIYSTLNTNTSFNGVWITDNYFLLDNLQSPSNVLGMKFAGSERVHNAHITGNIFYNMTSAIVAAQPLVESVISGNSGSGIQAKLINLSGAASLDHYGTVVEDNTDSDPIPVVDEGTAKGFKLGFNMGGPSTAPTQLTGTQQATGPGCVIKPGAPLSACTITVSFSIPFADTAYSIQGCQIAGASANAVAGVAGSRTTRQFTVQETVLGNGGVSGGVLSCQVVHN